MSQIPQPFPYQGSKRKLASFILQFVPENTDRLVEPFAGSAAVSLAAAMRLRIRKFWLNDINEPLIQLWKHVVHSPESIVEEYRKLWEEQEGQERDFYDAVRLKFNTTCQPQYLLYLMCRCVKAAVRYNTAGGFNQSADHRRKGMRPSRLRENILACSELLGSKTKLTNVSYEEVLKDAQVGDLVYMDPPYQGVARNKETRYIKDLDYDAFVAGLEVLNGKRIPFVISYDGTLGEKAYGDHLPPTLRLKHILVNVGRSTQATLLGRDEDTVESLYLSESLLEKSEMKLSIIDKVSLSKEKNDTLLFDYV